MTGFGAASSEKGGVSLRAEVRSVNHRYLQVKVRVPPELVALEPVIDQLVRKRLSRGSVTVNLGALATDPASAGVDFDVARDYAERLGKLGRELELEGGVTLEALLALPGVVESGRDELVGNEKEVTRVVGAALDVLIEMREREGAALEKDMRKHAGELAKLVGKIEKRMPKVVRDHHEGLEKRLATLLEGRDVVVDASDLARELAVLADRTDVSEEVSRLASHLEQLDTRLTKGGAIGRQLDFLVQELFREANTIGSKCNDATVAHWVVEAKTQVERMREQVQNVE